MKRIFRLLIICSFLLYGFGIYADPLPPPESPESENLVTYPIYLPFLRQSGGGSGETFTVSGTVADVDGVPVAHVNITDLYGAQAVTDIDGDYSMNVQAGVNTLTATRSGYDIAPAHVNVVSNLTGVNFEAQVGCGSITVNESVTVGMGGWDFLTDQPDHVIAGTDTLIFNSAPSGGRTGINPGIDDNVASTTRARSQLYHIPSDADAVFLQLWIYQVATGAGEFDRQYIDILNENNNIISTLYYSSVGTGGWVPLEFSLDAYIGDSIKIQIRTLNDGGASAFTTYFDDVLLVICNTHCNNAIINGGFESQDPNPAISGWLFIGPQLITPVYTGSQFHTGFWSMRTGIPTTGIDQEAFTEVFQTVDLRDPSGHHYTEALLTFWLYTTRIDGIVPPVEPAPPRDFGPTREVPSLSGPSFSPVQVTGTPEEDWNYVYIFDNNWNFLDKPVWEKATNTNTWIRYELDVSQYLGQRIKLLFGTYNDGRGGPSAMYVDDVVLGRCE